MNLDLDSERLKKIKSIIENDFQNSEDSAFVKLYIKNYFKEFYQYLILFFDIETILILVQKLKLIKEPINILSK